MAKFHFNKVIDLAGFAMENKPQGSKEIQIMYRSILTSDELEFYKYIEQVSNLFLSKIGNTMYISNFVFLVHKDLSADLYFENLGVQLSIRPKRDFKKGEPIKKDEIADINGLKFSDIKIEQTDKVICCIKVGWKFGLLFDFNPNKKLDEKKLYSDLGELYRYLEFQYVYNVLENEKRFNEMLSDGWFPFIEIIGGEYKQISEIYDNEKFDIDNKIEELVAKFNKDRLDLLTNKWWKKDVFESKKKVLEAGIKAYLQGCKDGYINCIKNLSTEIEGVIRMKFFSDTQKSNGVKTPELVRNIIKKGKEKSGSDYSLFLPLPFLDYLNKVVFKNFNLENNDISLSRNTVGHGVANPDDYTKARALQLILCLDQIYYYI